MLTAALVHVVGTWLELPEALMLASVSPAMAAVLISIPAAAATAAGESLLLVATVSLAARSWPAGS